VAAGHNNLDKVKSLLLEFPTLLYATWDLDGSDFETGLEVLDMWVTRILQIT
jgi:hypothetical protein